MKVIKTTDFNFKFLNMKVLMLLFVAIIVTVSAIGQQLYSITGVVNDNKMRQLQGASVFILPTNSGKVSGTDGKFNFGKLPRGKYVINITYVGFVPFSDTLFVNENIFVEIQMSPSLKTLQEVVITDNYAEYRNLEESLNVEIINEEYLKQNLSGSLMKSLERLPGVSSIGIGSGQSKPTIRGLGFNRVVVVENGIKHEGQQWGADHGLEVDQFSFDRIEVIKGPASLMYGSDAIGGIIDLKQMQIPTKNTLSGSIDLTGKSNNNLAGTSAFISKRWDKLFFTFRGTWLDFADYRVPTDSIDIYSYKAPLYENRLRNTAGKEQNFHFSAGYLQNGFSTRFYVSNVYNKNGFFANAHGLEPRRVDTELHDKSGRDIQYPFQTVSHFKTTNKSEWRNPNAIINLELGFQQNFREEWSQYVSHGYMPPVFPENLNFPADLERQFDKTILSGNAKAEFQKNEKTNITGGFNSEYQKNKIDGRGFIIPAFRQFRVGAFFHLKYAISAESQLQAGARYDYGSIDTEHYTDWFPSPVETETDWEYMQRAAILKRNFSNFTWSVGYNFNREHFSFKANAGKSFRIPIAKELAANGVNYHHFSYEVGDPNLSPEISYQLDAGIETHTRHFAIGITPFVNYFSNYIYLNPGYEHDRLYGNGNQVFYYTQSKVFRWGGEIHSHFEITKSLQAGLIVDYVYSVQTSGIKKGFTLPFSPPASAIINLKYIAENLGWFRKPFLTLDYKIGAAQNNIVPPEEKTPGFQTVNIGLGGKITWRDQPVSVAFQIQNLLDKKYFNHTSYYRLINVPEPGRNFIVNISIPFSGKIKQK